MYVCSFNVLIDSEQNRELEWEIAEAIKSSFADKRIELVSMSIEDVNGNNYGRCENCGEWVTDNTKENRISAFSVGAKVDGKWFCDLCLPEDHSNHF